MAVFVLAMLTGGFNFFQTWLFWILVVFFLFGVARRVEPDESLWRRVIALSSTWFFVPLVFRASLWWLAVLVAIGPSIPTAAGLFTRRLLAKRKDREEAIRESW